MIINDHIANVFKSHNIKFKEFLYVSGQWNFLSTPLQPILGFNIGPYGNIFWDA